jgi:hypothetical protein
VVQPCLVSGLVVLLWLGATKLGESSGWREYVAVGAIVVGVGGVAWAAPERTTDHADIAAIALALGLIAIPIAAPYALRGRPVSFGMLAVIGAGCGYAWTAIASKPLTDELAAGEPSNRDQHLSRRHRRARDAAREPGLLMPVQSAITDLAGLRYWVHPGVDMHYVTHPRVDRGGREAGRPRQRRVDAAADLA